MRMRKKKSMLIGILCCLLVFMGVGYAALSQVLNITSTANVTGSFNIIIDDIESVPTRTSGATSANERAPKDTTASYEVTFYKPGDYITYDVTVKNLGSIKGVLKSVEVTQTPNQEMQNMLDNKGLTIEDVFETKVYETDTTDDIALNQVLDTEGVYNFDIRTTLKDIDFIPNGTMRTKIEVIYAQEGNKSSDTPGEEVVDDYTGPDIEVNAEGLLTRINIDKYTEDGWLKLPAETPDGQPIKSIDKNSFLKYNVVQFWDYDQEMDGYIIYDENNFAEIKETIKNVYGLDDAVEFYRSGEIGLSQSAYINPYYVNTELEIIDWPLNTIEKLDLTDASDLTTIKEGAFANGQLSEIYFGSSITTIEDGAFFGNQISGELDLSDCTKLTSVTGFSRNQITNITLPSNVTSIEYGAFESNQIDAELDLSSYTNLTTVAGFSNNQITGIKLPSSVSTIKGNGFEGEIATFESNRISGELDLSNLTQLEEICDGVFFNNEITSIKLPTSVTVIEPYAFSNNQIGGELDLSNYTSLTSLNGFNSNQITGIKLPSSVTEIGYNAFEYNKISNLTIPSSVTSIGDYAFASQNYDESSGEYLGLSKVKYERCRSDIGSGGVFGKELEVTIDSGEVPDYMFSGSGVINLTLGDGVTSIGYSSFESNRISVLTLPSGITTIGDYAFADNQINQLTIPNNVTMIGYNAFAENQIDGELDLSNLIKLTSVDGFANNQITSIKLPKNITTIEGSAFSQNKINGGLDLSNCTKLASISGFDNNEITSIKFPGSLETIGYNAFSYNQILSLTLPDNISTIGYNAFAQNQISGELDLSNCTRLTNIRGFDNNQITSIKLPSSVITIEAGAFSNNKISGELDLSNCIKLLSLNGFYNNEITSIKLPKNITTIEGSAFSHNQILSLTIPSSVTMIRSKAFTANPLESISIQRTQQDFNANVLSSFGWFDGNPAITFLSE